MLKNLLLISLGASLGACCRYLLSLALNPLFSQLQLGILISNCIGAYLIGVCVALLEQQELKILIITGFLGSLTTLSSLSLEVTQLFQKQQYVWGVMLLGMHIFSALLLTILGMYSAQVISH